MRFAKFDLLQWLTPDVQEEFLARLYRRHYAAGQPVYVQGAPGTEMYRLVAGTVKISVLRGDGRHITYRLFESGDCFGQTSLVDGEPRPQSTAASSAVEVGVLSKTDFRWLSDRFPVFDRAIARLMAAQLRAMAQNYEGASLDSLQVRVARQLLLSRAMQLRTAEQEEQSQSQIQMSQADLAAMVGASRQSVNRVLQKLREEHVIEIGYGRIDLADLSALKSITTR